MQLGSDPIYLERLKVILELSRFGGAQYFAVVCMKGIFVSSWNKIDLKTKLGYREFLLSFLNSKASSTSVDTLKAVIQCAVLLLKLAWFDDPVVQETISQLQSMSSQSYSHWQVALLAFDALIGEMTYISKGCHKFRLGRA
jgi:hypothetical protein